MKKLFYKIYAIPSLIVMLIILNHLSGYQLDSARIYQNLLRILGADDHFILKMIYVAYVFIASGLHIFVTLFIMLFKHRNEKLFYVGLGLLCFMPIRVVLIFMLNFAYLPLSIFEFLALKGIISYIVKVKCN